MKRTIFLIFLGLWGLAAVPGCSKSVEPSESAARIELVHGAEGAIHIIGRNLPESAAVVQFEAVIASDDSFAVAETQAAPDLPLDSVRSSQAGRNRARFFLGDKRGIKLRQDGQLASFRLLRSSLGDKNGRVRIESLKVADVGGSLISVDIGPSILVK